LTLIFCRSNLACFCTALQQFIYNLAVLNSLKVIALGMANELDYF